MLRPIRALLIGFRPILADALSLLFAAEGSIDVLGSVTNADDLPESALSALNVLIFDGRVKTELGAAIRWWKQRCTQSRAIAVDVDQGQPLIEWIAGGLDGFVGSDAPTRELVEVIHRSLRNEAVSPYPLLKRVIERIGILSMQDKDKSSLLILTRRESEVLHLLAQGFSNKEIATNLNISLYTVKNHVHNVLEKLRVDYRRHAVRCALDNGLLKPSTPVVLPKFFSRTLEMF